MTPSKLSDSEKLDVARLYREPGETTSTLANRYGVSSTTIRRVLKSSLSQKEYETLTSQKQATRWLEVAGGSLQNVNISNPSDITRETTTQEATIQKELSLGQTVPAPPIRRLRRRSSATPALASDQTTGSIESLNPPANTSTGLEEVLHEEPTLNNFNSAQIPGNAPTEDFKEFLEDELDEELDSGLDELNDDDLEDDELELLPSEVLDEETTYTSSQVHPEGLVNVLPLSEASIPKTCYLVVDRSGELIARPLKEFSDLGQIPIGEVQEKMLPVFDNHRVARRFSNRNQRVIKIPDGGLLRKAGSQLYAKGITRLLINGQVYSL